MTDPPGTRDPLWHGLAVPAGHPGAAGDGPGYLISPSDHAGGRAAGWPPRASQGYRAAQRGPPSTQLSLYACPRRAITGPHLIQGQGQGQGQGHPPDALGTADAQGHPPDALGTGTVWAQCSGAETAAGPGTPGHCRRQGGGMKGTEEGLGIEGQSCRMEATQS